MRIRHAVCGAALLGALFVMTGCGGETTVSGNINVDGKRLPEGSITFFPVDGKTNTAGDKIFDGRYGPVKVPVGSMKVSISAPKIKGYKKLYNTPNSPERPLFAEALPEKYNEKTELRMDVKPGPNQKDFELQSK
jgi:hypothetical protein